MVCFPFDEELEQIRQIDAFPMHILHINVLWRGTAFSFDHRQTNVLTCEKKRIFKSLRFINFECLRNGIVKNLGCLTKKKNNLLLKIDEEDLKEA